MDSRDAYHLTGCIDLLARMWSFTGMGTAAHAHGQGKEKRRQSLWWDGLFLGLLLDVLNPYSSTRVHRMAF